MEEIQNNEKGFSVRTKINTFFRDVISGEKGITAIWENINTALEKIKGLSTDISDNNAEVTQQINKLSTYIDAEIAKLKNYTNALSGGLSGFADSPDYDPEIPTDKSAVILAMLPGTYTHFLDEEGNPIVITGIHPLTVFFKGQNSTYWEYSSTELSMYSMGNILPEGADLNTIITPGVYAVGNSAVNAPENSSVQDVLLVYNQSETLADIHNVLQVCYSINTGAVSYRMRILTVWKPWADVSGSAIKGTITDTADMEFYGLEEGVYHVVAEVTHPVLGNDFVLHNYVVPNENGYNFIQLAIAGVVLYTRTSYSSSLDGRWPNNMDWTKINVTHPWVKEGMIRTDDEFMEALYKLGLYSVEIPDSEFMFLQNPCVLMVMERNEDADQYSYMLITNDNRLFVGNEEDVSNWVEFVKKGALDSYQLKNDQTLSTKSKTVVGAINELSEGKQAKLVSGTNIKTVNGKSILGDGDLQIEGGGGGDDFTIKKTITTEKELNSLVEAGFYYINFSSDIPGLSNIRESYLMVFRSGAHATQVAFTNISEQYLAMRSGTVSRGFNNLWEIVGNNQINVNLSYITGLSGELTDEQMSEMGLNTQNLYLILKNGICVAKASNMTGIITCADGITRITISFFGNLFGRQIWLIYQSGKWIYKVEQIPFGLLSDFMTGSDVSAEAYYAPSVAMLRKVVGTGGSDIEIVNDLTSGGADKALSAEMGKQLEGDKINYDGSNSSEGAATKLIDQAGVAATNYQIGDSTPLLINAMPKGPLLEPYDKLWCSITFAKVWDYIKSKTDAEYAGRAVNAITDWDFDPSTVDNGKDGIYAVAGTVNSANVPENEDAPLIGAMISYAYSLSDRREVLFAMTCGARKQNRIYIKKYNKSWSNWALLSSSDIEIVNSLDSDSTDKALSAAMGKLLSSKVTPVLIEDFDAFDPRALGMSSGEILPVYCEKDPPGAPSGETPNAGWVQLINEESEQYIIYWFGLDNYSNDEYTIYIRTGSPGLNKFSWNPWNKIPSETFLENFYQPLLKSGTNIKTINGKNLLGSGDITIGEGVTLTGDPSEQTIDKAWTATLSSRFGMGQYPAYVRLLTMPGSLPLFIGLQTVLDFSQIGDLNTELVLPPFEATVTNRRGLISSMDTYIMLPVEMYFKVRNSGTFAIQFPTHIEIPVDGSNTAFEINKAESYGFLVVPNDAEALNDITITNDVIQNGHMIQCQRAFRPSIVRMSFRLGINFTDKEYFIIPDNLIGL